MSNFTRNIWKPTIEAYIVILDKDNKESVWTIYNKQLAESISEIKHLEMKYCFLCKEDIKSKEDEQRTVPVLIIPASEVPTKRVKSRSVAKCAYSATDTYMNHWLGIKLDHNDSTWYERNSLCTADGLPQAHTFTVLQQLVEVYGVGISHIIVPRHGRLFPEYKPFMAALGCNPFFLTDGNTTNEEALIKLFPDENERIQNKNLLNQWKFECRDEPLKGSVLMRLFSHDPGHNGGSTYRGARDNSNTDNWIFSIKFDKLENIKYLRDIQLPEYKEFEGSLEYDFENIQDGDTLLKNRKKERNFKLNWKSELDSKVPLELVPKDSDLCPTCNQNAGRFYQRGIRTCIECGNSLEKKTKDTFNDLREFYNCDDDEYFNFGRN